MSVEFDLGPQDHHKVEDFLAHGASGVAAIRLHALSSRHQVAAAEAAREAGIDVLWDPRTERLTAPDPDGHLHGLPGAAVDPLDLDLLVARSALRLQLVEQVLAAHPEQATLITPPTFLIENERAARLVIDLADSTRVQADRPVRPRLILSSKLAPAVLLELAKELFDGGIESVELQVTPMTAEREGIRKIRLVLGFARALTAAGLRVTLGHSGNLGQAAVALGVVAAYSVGIGQDEQVNYRNIVQRQAKPPRRVDEDGNRITGGGRWQGVYLPPLALTTSRRAARDLLEHSDIRTRIGCRIGSCAQSINGPALQPEAHYLHARAGEMVALQAVPAAWRPKQEADRLTRAVELRTLVNDSYRPSGMAPLATRSLTSLLEALHSPQQRRAVA